MEDEKRTIAQYPMGRRAEGLLSRSWRPSIVLQEEQCRMRSSMAEYLRV